MTYQDLVNIEKSIDTSGIMLDGQWIYPVIKQGMLVNRLMPMPHSNNEKPHKKDIIKSLIIDFWFYVRTQHNIKQSDYVFFDATTYRRFVYKKKILSIFTDSVVELLQLNKATIIEATPKQYKTPTFSKRVVYENWLSQKLLIKNKFIKPVINVDFSAFHNLFEQLGVEIADKELKAFLSKFKLFQSYYAKLLQRLKPKVVFIVCAYTYKRMALINACKSAGIPTVELQHGFIYDNHPGYSYSENYGNNFFPDFLFAHGSFFKDELIKNSKIFTDEQIKVVGSPFLEFYDKANISLQNTELLNFIKNKKVILFSGQDSVQKSNREFLKELLPQLPKGYVLILKTHPAEHNAKDFYKDLFQHQNFYLEEHENILSLLKISNIHSTVYSTVLFEALFFQKPTILLHSEKYSSAAEHLVNGKDIFMANNVNQFTELLNQDFNKEIDANEFYEKNTSEKLVKYLNEII